VLVGVVALLLARTMPPTSAIIAKIIDEIDTQRRRRHYYAIRQLINSGSSIIPLFPRRQRRVLPYKPAEFQLDNYTDDWCLEFLRFSRQQIKEILPFLRLDLCTWRNRYNPTPEAAFCLLLYKLSWPHRLKDATNIFGHSIAWQSSVYIDILRHLVCRYCNMLYWDHQRLTRSTIQRYAACIYQHCQVPNIWGFIDGTIRPMCYGSDSNLYGNLYGNRLPSARLPTRT
jgi:hypothetical protein